MNPSPAKARTTTPGDATWDPAREAPEGARNELSPARIPVASRIALLAIAALPLVGSFLSGPNAWGFNHLAYLPRVVGLLWIFGFLLLVWPRAADVIGSALAARGAGRWLTSPVWTVAVAMGAAGLFALLRERSFFMGDGYLIGELVDRGVPFRAFDNMDYWLHFQIWKLLGEGKFNSFTLYRIGSVVAGFLAVLLLAPLARRLPWEDWRKVAWLVLVGATGPALLFFGYVESYTYLYVCMTAFLLTGVLAFSGRISLVWPGVFFGLALAFHLTALFSAPALLFLLLRAPAPSRGRAFLQLAAPVLVLFGISVALHFATGYDAQWFRKEFMESKNAKSIWIPFDTARGLFSFYHWKDHLNLSLITAPACLVWVLSRWRACRARIGDPRVGFLLVQMAGVVVFSLLLDRKLGGARDWDLFAAHAGGLLLLCALLLPDRVGRNALESDDGAAGAGSAKGATPSRGAAPAPGAAVGLVVGASLLCSASWVVLEHWEEKSIARFVDVAADFPAFARAYAYEEVGKYYRKAEDLPRAEEMYERCIEAYPKNPRFRVLLGSIYFVRAKLDDAEREYRAALEIDPDHRMANEMMGNLLVARAQSGPAPEAKGLFDQAANVYFRLTELEPRNAKYWQAACGSSLRAGRSVDAARAAEQALKLDPNLPLRFELATALMGQGKFAEAVPAFRDAIRSRDAAERARVGLAVCLTAKATDELRALGHAEGATMAEIEEQVRLIRATNANLDEANEIETRLALLRRGMDPDDPRLARAVRPLLPPSVPR